MQERGTGKTSVLTKKIVYLIDEIKLNPQKILALTFTNKAANEMKERVISLLDENNIVIENINKLFIGTFHSFCAKFLRMEILNLKSNLNQNFSIIDQFEQHEILKKIIKEKNLDKNDISVYILSDFISKVKNGLEVDSNDENLEIKKECFKIYNFFLIENNLLDFDDLILYTLEILKNNLNVLQKWKNFIDYILIDEFQDTSNKQFELILLLCKDEKITIVGDPDQTIYSWRGANIEYILNFDSYFPLAKTIILKLNYRSTFNILNSANNIISNNENRIKKDLICVKNEKQNHYDIKVFKALNQLDEANLVLEEIKKLLKENYKFKDIAILYRSNYYSRSIEAALNKNLIPNKIFGGIRFYERSEIKESLYFLKTILEKSNYAFSKIINIPHRGIGEKTINLIVLLATENNQSFIDFINLNLDQINQINSSVKNQLRLFVNLIIKYNQLINQQGANFATILFDFLNEINYFDYLKKISINTNIDREENVNELLASMQEWIKNNPNNTIYEYLQDVSLSTSLDEGKSNNEYVSLMSIHQAKGLEFKCLFIIGLNENVFPSNRISSKKEFEEERRLAYVAFTRAKEKLFVSYTQENNLFNSYNFNDVSRFLIETKLKLENDKIKWEQRLNNNDNFSNLDSKTNEENFFKNNDDLKVDDLIKHSIFGLGKIIEVSNDTICVKFNDKKQGQKTLFKNHKSIEKVQ